MAPILGKSIAVRLLVTGVCALTLGISAFAAGDGAVVTQVQKEASLGQKKAAVGDQLSAGEPVVTGAKSRLELKLANGGVARIGQGSNFKIDGSKLALSRGSALFKLPGKNETISTPSFNCGVSDGVVSIHSAKGYEACFFLTGSGSVNGVKLAGGEAYVKENGKARKIVFDVKRLAETSSLVTKFAKAPWMTEVFAAAAIQHQLAAVNRAETALLNGRVSGADAMSTAAFVSQLNASLAKQNIKVELVGGKLLASNAAGQTTSFSLNQISGNKFSVSGPNAGKIVESLKGGLLTKAGASSSTGGITKVGGGSLTISNGSPAIASGANLVVSSGASVTTITGSTVTLTSGGTLNFGGTLVNSGTQVLHLGEGALRSINGNIVNGVLYVNGAPVNGSVVVNGQTITVNGQGH